ncbi:MAG: TIGR04084 family radical SAM/SPASM domain-containing protein [Nitrososphaeria archaeon]|nr:TIGR04084 family radical SAM/SPASM domain-containing protein [Nitrososphaeria archaeon]
MLFILYTTGRCNLRCRYCGGSFDPSLVPWSVKYPLRLLEELFREGDSIAFYGGEPLLNTDFMRNVMETFDAEHYIIQTNGLLADKLDEGLLKKMDTILLSIDGRVDVTDKNRGRGVYEAVVKSAKKLRVAGFRGDLVARMAVTQDSDIYLDVSHLLDLGFFDHVHWQLSMIWVDKGEWSNLWWWINESYRPGLERLLREWIGALREGVVRGIVPFQGILKRILHGGPCPPCGSGVDSFTILTDGRVVSCPIAVSEEWAAVGVLGGVNRADLEKYKPEISEPCKSCNYFRECGARCLYTHMERLWGDEGVRATCEVSRYLIDLIRGKISEIFGAASDGVIPIDEILYPKYSNTVEVMP